jgi:hypothetical protein
LGVLALVEVAALVLVAGNVLEGFWAATLQPCWRRRFSSGRDCSGSDAPSMFSSSVALPA